jgi:hypothetical protein
MAKKPAPSPAVPVAPPVERRDARPNLAARRLEAELVRLERELTNKVKDAIVARQQAAKRGDRNLPDRPATKALMQLSL